MINNVCKLCLLMPCYNEEKVLQETPQLFLEKLTALINAGKISPDSRIIFVDDGSADRTWELISKLSRENKHFGGLRLSRNRGHQNAVLAGLMETKDDFDAIITLDVDGQDDINVVDEMVQKYKEGNHIVYGVRNNRDSDTFFKRFTAESFYRTMNFLGVETVFNHADCRLTSSVCLQEFARFNEVNLFLRGMFPLVGFKNCQVAYSRKSRLAGESHYPLKKMLYLAFEGITSLSVRPLRMIFILGLLSALFSVIGIIWTVTMELCGSSVPGWASMTSIIFFCGGLQLISTGVLGEYIGKIYLEVKQRPRYIISDRIL